MAVDSEIMSILKDLPHRLDSSKLKDRIRIFKDIDNVVAIEGLPDGVLKGLCKIPILTLHQYKNTKSRSFITNLILKLLKYNENLVVKYLTTNLVDISSNFKCLTITPTVADDCLTCLTWSCIVMKYILDKKNTSSPAIKDLIQSQVILVSCALAANDKIITKKAYKRMQHVWSTPDAVDTYRSFIVDYKEPPNCHVVVFNSQFVQFLNDNKQVALIKDLKQCYIEQFLKSMVVGKVDKAPKYVLIQLKPLLRHVNHEEFKERLLPSMQKAMLRNPEIVLPCVSAIIDSVTIDLSQYASDIGKILTPQLHSNMEECRVEAIQACSLLAKQSSDPQTLSEIVKYIFAVLNGCNGKLTVVTQRIGLISGIGNLSNNTVSGTSSLQELSSLVSDSFVTVLKQEVHEDILISALNSLSLWSPKFSSKVPKSLIDIFKTGPGLKTSTSAVRNAYIRCMISSFHGNTLTDAVEVVPQLIKTIEKALSQSNHVSYVAEGLSASCLILNIHRADLIIDKQISNCISNLLDMQKVPFFTEKFINQVDDEGIMSLITFIERLMCDHFTSIKGCKKPIYSAILQIMTHSSQKVRKRSHHSLRKIINLFNSVDIPKSLLLELCAFLDSHQFLFPNMVKDDVNENNESSNFVNAVYAVSALECITSELDVKDPNVEVDIESLALMALNASCHPIILTIERDMYLKVLNNLGLDVDSFIENHSEELMKSIIEMNSPLLRKSVESVVQISPLNLLPQFINFAVEIFENHNFGKVSKTDYEIFLTPEGELYDRSCIENMKEEVQTKNVKRESKLYSYKDQMADIALRKELEEKKKAKGVKVEPQLTKKQQEAMKAQLEKESSIRSDVKLLHKNFNQAMHIMESCLNGNSEYFLREMSYILPIMISNLSSPLCAEKIANFFVNLGKRIFKSDIYLGLSIAYVLLRIKKPAFTIDNAWTEEDLTAAIKRVVSKLYSSTRPKSKSDFVDSNSDNSRFHDGILTAPAFSYAFVLLKEVLRLNLHDYEDEIMKSVEMISDHTHMRSSFDELMDPQLLPIKSMFQALISLLADASGKLQVLTSQAIEDVACCSSGKDDCAAASEEETTLLLDSLLYSSTAVRDSVLRSLIQMTDIILVWKSNESFCTLLTQRLFVAQFDLVDDVKELAKQLWDACSLKLNDKLADYLIKDVCHPAETIRHSSSLALANYIGQFPKITNGILKSLFAIYHSKLEMPAPILDNFGRLVSEPPADPWEPRSGIALSMCKMASSFTSEDVQELMSFFVPEGLGDRHEDVRKEMLNAAMAVIDIHGKDQVLHLLPVFEDFLDKAPKTSSYDTVRQSVVILMGCLARHLDKTDPKVKPIIYKLIDALSTPSQQVQEAVSNCLPPLIPAVKEEAPALVKRLLNLLLESDNYGERKGAAYGLAGLVKGLGILALKQLDIMNSLTTAIQNKKNHKHREGALFAFEMLCSVLGRLFEPYIVHVLPHLLLCFGDGNQYVREATDDTAKAVMSKLSAHGVKLVLPSLLAALEEDSWRTKTGSVELLGAMAFCAPKQLSSCLPNIVPKLIEVLSDSHAKVQKAGAQALKVIGSVIRNPEIQAIVDVLLEALQDPSKKTAVCLGTLLNTKFIHFIDAPSLALIMPVVQRAFKDRSTETRKMAAQIIGNMYSLTDHKDLGPYLPNITPGLQQSLLDPVPDVRCVSARALGAMVKGMGESCFETLMPWLMQTLTSETSSVDRSGAAQGLSEVIGGLGVDKLHKLMPEIISTAQRTDIVAHVKDGYMMLFIYMPVVFPKEFTQYIGKIINPILKALADENEYVRDTALKAGQRIVNMYAENAITLLLPQLEAGLFDENWRIRYSSVQLLGDLLYKISGVSGKMTTETASEDDNFGTEQSQKIILNILGMERRNRVLAGLYMGRSDTALMVRQAALHVWKIIVTNTPRTLREILPTLFSLLLGCLASTSYDKRQVAARTLGDLVRKLGERVLPEIIPILEKGLESNQPDQRQGVCIGLSEIMTSTSREMVLTFVDSLVPTVRKALCDPLPEVRQAAAKTFDSLHSTVGSRALDDILPQLLEQLNNPELSECTLDGLKNVMAIKSRVVLPYLVPQLTAEPVNTKALSFLSAVAGDALNKHLSKILPALLSALGSAMDTSAEQQEKEYCERVILSVQDDLGVRTIMDDLMEATKAKEDKVRRAAVSLLYAFCCQTRADYAQYVSQLIRGLILLFIEKDTKILQLSWDALTAVVKTLEPSEQLQHVSTVRQAVRFVISDSKEALLPGFCLSKGITPILPIFREAILNGQPELKEQAATGLGEVIKITSPEALQPSVVHITGPLIRILGDRFSWNVKASVLDTLALLLAKVGVKLKPFLPQLQTTFLKALIDPHRSVRLKAAAALSHLIVIHTRVDQLFTDLRNNVKTVEESGIRETMLQALRGIITPAGNKISESVRKQLVQTLVNLTSHHEDVTRMSAAGCLGAFCTWLPDDELQKIVTENILEDDPSDDWTIRHGKSVILFVALKEAAPRILTNSWSDGIMKTIHSYLTSDRIPIVLSGIRGMAFLMKHILSTNNCNVNQKTWNTFVKLMNHSSNEVKQLIAQTIQFLSKSCDTLLPTSLLKSIIPQLVNGTKEKNTIVKANCEYALVAVLKLRDGESNFQTCLNSLDSGAKDSLNDVVSKVLRKVASHPDSKEDELDDTLLI